MIRSYAPTFDEPVHLASGYTDLVSGRYHLNSLNHPPLAEMWAGLALLPLKPSAFFQHSDFYAGRVYNFADYFLYKNKFPAEMMLDRARLWCLVTWSVALALGIAAWAFRLGGIVAAAGSLALLAFCPALISNSALVTTDAASTVFFFSTFWLLSFRPRSRKSWALAGAAMGLAMASKFNMAVLPVFAGVLLLVESKVTAKQGGRLDLAGFSWMAASAFLALAAVYRFTSVGLYWDGMVALFTLLDQGRPSFFFGSHSTNGTWLYFPAALLIKTPIPILAAAGAGLLWCFARPDADKLWVVAPPLAYFLAACAAKTQIGYRHILPIYPFLIVLGGLAMERLWRKGAGAKAACAAGGVWLAASVIGVSPDQLSYFNELVGGPSQGYRYLSDSNVDWGQGLKTLAARLRGMGNPPVVLCYFGVADPSYYGIRYLPLGFTPIINRHEGIVEPSDADRVLLAVSATNLQSTYYANKDSFGWLKSRAPLFVVDHSIFVYDLTEDGEGARSLAQLLIGDGQVDYARRLMLRYKK